MSLIFDFLMAWSTIAGANEVQGGAIQLPVPFRLRGSVFALLPIVFGESG